jgi:hypothetical protein
MHTLCFEFQKINNKWRLEMNERKEDINIKNKLINIPSRNNNSLIK